MKRKRKLIQKSAVCALTVTMIASQLCGCGSKENQETVEAWNETEVSVTEAPEEDKSLVDAGRRKKRDNVMAVADNSDEDNNDNSSLGDIEDSSTDDSIWENGVNALYVYENGVLTVDEATMAVLVDKQGDAWGYSARVREACRDAIEHNIKSILIAYETGYTDEDGVRKFIETGEWDVKDGYNTGTETASNENTAGGTGNTGTTIAQQPTEGNQQSSGGDTQQPIIDNNNNTEVADNNQWNEAPEGTYESNVYQGDWTHDPEFRAAAEAQGAYIGTHEEIQAIIEYTENHLDESKYEGVGFN